jgi:hypothetical protein
VVEKMERTPEEKNKMKDGLEKYIEDHKHASEIMCEAIEKIDEAINIVSTYDRSFTYHGLAEAQGKMTVAGVYIDHEIDNAKKLLKKIQEDTHE